MNIIIFDSAQYELMKLSRITEKICQGYHIDVTIQCFSDSQACKSTFNKKKVNIALIGIDLCGELGIGIVRWICKVDKNCRIIVISNCCEYAIEGFRLNICHYLLKPVTAEELLEGLRRASKEFNLEKSLSITHDYNKIDIQYNTIAYIEVNKKKCLFHILNGSSLSWYIRMDTLEEVLWEHNIVRCHRSYMVNLAIVVEINRNFIHLQEGSIIPLSRGKRKDLINLYSDYLFQLK